MHKLHKFDTALVFHGFITLLSGRSLDRFLHHYFYIRNLFIVETISYRMMTIIDQKNTEEIICGKSRHILVNYNFRRN